jgi:uncharacterized membrane protein YkvA (DUF1232 family)
MTTGKDITVFDPARLRADEVRVRRGFWRKFARVAGRIPFAEDLLAAYYCAVDRETPTYVRAVLMGAVAYFVVPADLIPDFIAGFGFSDDATVLLTAVSAVSGQIRARHRRQARKTLHRPPAAPDDAGR